MDPDDIAIGIIAGLLEARTGQKLTEDRRWRIAPALSGLFRERGISSNQDLVVLLTQPDESSLAQDVVEALLNNETYFFRDRQIFDYLAATVLPQLAARRAAERKLSIWSVGCSTGQETLSLAMTFLEQQGRWDGWTIEILGTDVSTSVVDFARAATYSNFQIQRGLGVGQMLGFFTESPTGWRARDTLRGVGLGTVGGTAGSAGAIEATWGGDGGAAGGGSESPSVMQPPRQSAAETVNRRAGAPRAARNRRST